ncbi:uncharacterized protein si:dkey-261l7.2 isoform X2 [Electrophorus electricus]|uniref:Hemimethylated DNA-binding domain-containing protein n=1 Tax=Electrophorus electricus TaxID=8005 RepID=A0AAY5EYI7_ELEEL|nr:uncharacterized protein si:dkey-261l7.2 isoform X2 [Electrophorus electricus]
MPQITAMAMLQLALLLSALPAQYLISKWTSGNAAQRSLATQGVFGAEEAFEHALEESLALDLLMQSNDQGYFGASEEKRSPRPEYVLHRVGDVVLERQNRVVGVIVGWDAGLRAPPEWLKRKKFTESEIKRLEDTPHYRILFSGPDPSSLLIGYLPQTVIHLFDGYKPDIPTLGQYFSHFDGKRFVMQGWLKDLYPDD